MRSEEGRGNGGRDGPADCRHGQEGGRVAGAGAVCKGDELLKCAAPNVYCLVCPALHLACPPQPAACTCVCITIPATQPAACKGAGRLDADRCNDGHPRPSPRRRARHRQGETRPGRRPPGHGIFGRLTGGRLERMHGRGKCGAGGYESEMDVRLIRTSNRGRGLPRGEEKCLLARRRPSWQCQRRPLDRAARRSGERHSRGRRRLHSSCPAGSALAGAWPPAHRVPQ